MWYHTQYIRELCTRFVVLLSLLLFVCMFLLLFVLFCCCLILTNFTHISPDYGTGTVLITPTASEATQRTDDAIMTSLLRQNDVATSFWRKNDFIASGVRWQPRRLFAYTNQADGIAKQIKSKQSKTKQSKAKQSKTKPWSYNVGYTANL